MQDHVRETLVPAAVQTAAIAETERVHRQLDELNNHPDNSAPWLDCINRAEIRQGSIRVQCNLGKAATMLNVDPTVWTEDDADFTIPFAIRRRGLEAKLIIGGKQSAAFDQTLIDNLARAKTCRDALKTGQSLMQIAERQGVSSSRIKQLLRMAFIAPDIVRDIMRGDQPAALTSEWLQRNVLPDDWDDQRRLVSALR